MCAHAVRVTVERIPGVERATLHLNEGRAIVELAPGNAVALEQLRASVRRNGFTPREARVHAVVEVERGPAGLRLRVSGTDDVFEPSTDEDGGVAAQLRAHLGQRVAVEGLVPVADSRTAPPVMVVTRIDAASR